MRRNLKAAQRQMRLIAAKLTGTGTAALGEGSTQLALTDNGTGDWTLAINEPFAREPVVTASSLTASTIIKIHAVSASSIQIKAYAVDGTTAKDAVLDILICGADVADAI